MFTLFRLLTVAIVISSFLQQVKAQAASRIDTPETVQQANGVRIVTAYPGLTCGAKIQAALDSLPETGGAIEIPLGTCNVTMPINVTKPVVIKGHGPATLLTFNGITLFKISTGNVTISDLMIQDVRGHANSVAISFDNGSVGLNNFSLRNLRLIGPYQRGSRYGQLGTAIRTLFALKGVISASNIEGWKYGISLNPLGAERSNAINITGTKIRQNEFGLVVTDTDSLFIQGCTIEGNSTGLKGAGHGRISVAQTHFENNQGAQRNVDLTDTSYESRDNFYSAARSHEDIVVNSGPGPVYSSGDTLNSGITHNGNGEFHISEQQASGAVAGTGPVFRHTGFGTDGTNTSSRIWHIRGFNSLRIEQPVLFYQAGTKAEEASSISAPSSDVSWDFVRPATAMNNNVQFRGKRGSYLFTDNMALGNSGNRWQGVFATTGDFSGLITSSLPAGTAPMSIRSSTKVANLNADKVDGLDVLTGSRFWDPPEIAEDAVTSVTVNLPGAMPGKPCVAGFDQAGARDVLLFCNIQSINTARVVMLNKTGGRLLTGGGNVTVQVWQ